MFKRPDTDIRRQNYSIYRIPYFAWKFEEVGSVSGKKA